MGILSTSTVRLVIRYRRVNRIGQDGIFINRSRDGVSILVVEYVWHHVRSCRILDNIGIAANRQNGVGHAIVSRRDKIFFEVILSGVYGECS